MIGHFPLAFTDEVLYGVCSRYSDFFRFPSKREVINQLFSSNTLTAVVDLPSHLDDLINNLPPGYPINVKDLLIKHTMLPLYMPFLPEHRYEQIIQDMRGHNGPGIKMRIGAMASTSTVRNKTTLRYCLLCVQHDRELNGEVYWHRVHQAPGVLFCPRHLIPLREYDIWKDRQVTRYEFVSLERVLHLHVREIATTCYQPLLNKIALRVQLLLDNPIYPIGLEKIHDRYKRLLSKLGYANYSGLIHMRELENDFRNKYPEELLFLIGCELSDEVKVNWLMRILRSRATVHSPLRHILLLEFLDISIRDFFCTEMIDGGFNKNPSSCINPVSEQNFQLVTGKHNVKMSINAVEGRIDKAGSSYEYEYSMSSPDDEINHYTTHRKSIKYGPDWENELIKLWGNQDHSLHKIAKMLCVDPRTVQRHAHRLGLPFPRWNGIRSEINPKYALRNVPKTDSIRRKRDSKRLECSQYLEESPEHNRSSLRRKKPALYTWLYRNDREWLFEQRPRPESESTTKYSRVDWSRRDEVVAQAVTNAAEKMMNSTDKPVFMSNTAIATESGYLSLIQKHISKLPKTKERLTAFAETRETNAIRRIWWAAKKCISKGESPQLWVLIRLSGTSRLKDDPNILRELVKAKDYCCHGS